MKLSITFLDALICLGSFRLAVTGSKAFSCQSLIWLVLSLFNIAFNLHKNGRHKWLKDFSEDIQRAFGLDR